jgi:hypothetical protein
MGTGHLGNLDTDRMMSKLFLKKRWSGTDFQLALDGFQWQIPVNIVTNLQIP